MSTLTATTQEKSGDIPEPKVASSLNYNDGTLYLYGRFNYNIYNSYNYLMYYYSIANQTWEVIYSEGGILEARDYHVSAIYNNDIYILYGLLISVTFSYEMWKFDTFHSNWAYLKQDNGYLIHPGLVQINFSLYMVGGSSVKNIYNHILHVDLSSDSLDVSVLSPNLEAPPKRKEFCITRSNDEIYIFGGIDNDRNHLNDMWKFSFTYSECCLLYTSPSPRDRQKSRMPSSA